MFNDTKYTKWYNSIVDNARNRVVPDTYTEKHHIIPKSMGGKETVALTAKEHYICHHLLTKMVGHKHRVSMWNAFFLMHSHPTKNKERYITARGYQYSKNKMAEAKKKLTGIKNHFYGKVHSDKTRMQMKQNWNREHVRHADKKIYKFNHPEHGTKEVTRLTMLREGYLTAKETYKLVHGCQKTSKGWRIQDG